MRFTKYFISAMVAATLSFSLCLSASQDSTDLLDKKIGALVILDDHSEEFKKQYDELFFSDPKHTATVVIPHLLNKVKEGSLPSEINSSYSSMILKFGAKPENTALLLVAIRPYLSKDNRPDIREFTIRFLTDQTIQDVRFGNELKKIFDDSSDPNWKLRVQAGRFLFSNLKGPLKIDGLEEDLKKIAHNSNDNPEVRIRALNLLDNLLLPPENRKFLETFIDSDQESPEIKIGAIQLISWREKDQIIPEKLKNILIDYLNHSSQDARTSSRALEILSNQNYPTSLKAKLIQPVLNLALTTNDEALSDLWSGINYFFSDEQKKNVILPNLLEAVKDTSTQKKNAYTGLARIRFPGFNYDATLKDNFNPDPKKQQLVDICQTICKLLTETETWLKPRLNDADTGKEFVTQRDLGMWSLGGLFLLKAAKYCPKDGASAIETAKTLLSRLIPQQPENACQSDSKLFPGLSNWLNDITAPLISFDYIQVFGKIFTRQFLKEAKNYTSSPEIDRGLEKLEENIASDLSSITGTKESARSKMATTFVTSFALFSLDHKPQPVLDLMKAYAETFKGAPYGMGKEDLELYSKTITPKGNLTYDNPESSARDVGFILNLYINEKNSAAKSRYRTLLKNAISKNIKYISLLRGHVVREDALFHQGESGLHGGFLYTSLAQTTDAINLLELEITDKDTPEKKAEASELTSMKNRFEMELRELINPITGLFRASSGKAGIDTYGKQYPEDIRWANPLGGLALLGLGEKCDKSVGDSFVFIDPKKK